MLTKLMFALLLIMMFATAAMASVGAMGAVGVLTIVGAWLAAHAAFIIAATPTVIVGLSKSPKTQGIAAALKVALKFFSVVTHRDESGTFQLPFGLQVVVKRLAIGLQVVISRRSAAGAAAPGAGADAGSGAPVAVAAVAQPGAPSSPSAFPGGTAVMGAILGLFLVVHPSCAGWTPAQTQKLGSGLLDCTITATADSAIKVLPAVSTVIKGGTVNWEDQMTTLGLGFGVEAVMCAAKQVMASLAASPDSLRASPAFIKESKAAQDRATAYIKKHGLTPEKIKEPWAANASQPTAPASSPTSSPPAPTVPAVPPAPPPPPAPAPSPPAPAAPTAWVMPDAFTCGLNDLVLELL